MSAAALERPRVHQERRWRRTADRLRSARVRFVHQLVVRLPDRGFRILLLVGFLALGRLLLALLPSFPARLEVACLLQMMMYAGVGALAWRVGRETELHDRLRRGWLLIGLGLALTAAGDLVAVLSMPLGLDPAPFAPGLYIAATVLAIAGLFWFPLGSRTRQDRLTALLDGSIIVLAGAIATWVILIAPGMRAGLTPAELAATTLGPLGGLPGLVAAARLAVNPHKASHPLAGTLVVLAMLAFVTASIGAACAVNLGAGWTIEPGAFAALGTVFLAVGAHIQFNTPAARGELIRERRRALLVHGRALLSYVAVAIGFWFPLDAANSGRFDHFIELVLCAAALTTLIVLRQVSVLEHQRRAVAGLHVSESKYRDLLAHVPTVVYVADFGSHGSWRYVSPRVEELLGFSAEEWTSDPTFWWSRIHPDDRDLVEAEEIESWSIAGHQQVAVEYRMKNRDGQDRWVRDEATVVRHDDGSPAYWSGFLTDVTDRRSLEAQLQHQAFHDPLTGLANRALFTDRVEHAVLRTIRREGTIAILYLDLDAFKTMNDGLGHAAGDALLASVGARLQACLRPGDTAARLGGDEFAVLLEDVIDSNVPLEVAERVHEELTRPVNIQGREIIITTSIGVASSGGRAEEGASDLLRNADAAMYVAKRHGGGRTQLFDPTMNADAVRRLELHVDLRRATRLQEFVVHYQPVISLADGSVVGLEALVRWDHPERGLVSPAEFIALAEETGQITVIGRMVLERACRELKVLQDTIPGGSSLTVSVNISARQLQDSEFVAIVRDALVAASIDSRCLVLELTESLVMSDPDIAIDHLRELKALGLRLAVDDFGTGYSSLSYLQRLPVDILKVDRSLVEGVDDAGEGLALAEMIVHLGHAMGLQTVAEGVERPSQDASLRRLGFDAAQGYYYARPVPLVEVIDALVSTPAATGPSPAAPNRPLAGPIHGSARVVPAAVG